MKPSGALLAVLLAATCGAGAGPLPVVTIELRPQVEVGAAPVLLGQLARLESTDLPLLRRLLGLAVGRAPSAGDSAVVDREELTGWLRRRLGLLPGQVKWEGAPATRVLASTRVLTGEEIAAAATQGLREWLVARAVRSEVELVAPPRDIAVTEGEMQLRLRDPGHAQPRRRMTIWMEVWVAGRFVRVVPISFLVSAWGDGAIAALSLPAGALIHDGAVRRGEIDLTGDGARPAPVTAATRARRALAAGDVLRQGDLEPVPAVLRGEWASLRSGTGAVRTEARVQVLQDGRLGDKVRVRPAAAATSLLARVTAAGELEVAQ